MNKIWKFKNITQENGNVLVADFDSFAEEIRSIKSKIKLPEILIRLLYLRGVTTYTDFIKFLKPSIEYCHDPFKMKDMDIASKRILKAIREKEKIMILGDYDVDGTCGASMFYLFMKQFGIESDVYIPDRIKEGYGISIKSVDEALNKNLKLIVAIDFGITATEKVEYAKTKGIEFIICDHHQPPDVIPDALAVLDPLREDCTYPFKYLCGTGVAFKLIHAVYKLLGKEKQISEFYDYVAIATSSDIAPLVDENRVLVSLGFERINKNPRPAIKILLEKTGLDTADVNTTGIIFSVAPRINAVGRLGDAKRAFDMLTCMDEKEIGKLVSELNSENNERRILDKIITEEAFKIYDNSKDIDSTYAIILHKDDWHPGVIGIVAARLVEKYNLPAIVLSTVNGVAKGSARSINGFNVYEALKKCENYLIQFGGHCHAAGLEIELDKIEDFKKVFNEIASKELFQQDNVPEVVIDTEIKFKDIDYIFLNILNFFEPYGPGNHTPVFLTKNLEVAGPVRILRNNTHLFKLTDRNEDKTYDAIFPSSGDYHEDIKPGRECDVCYAIEILQLNGRTLAKLKIRDIKFN